MDKNDTSVPIVHIDMTFILKKTTVSRHHHALGEIVKAHLIGDYYTAYLVAYVVEPRHGIVIIACSNIYISATEAQF